MWKNYFILSNSNISLQSNPDKCIISVSIVWAHATTQRGYAVLRSEFSCWRAQTINTHIVHLSGFDCITFFKVAWTVNLTNPASNANIYFPISGNPSLLFEKTVVAVCSIKNVIRTPAVKKRGTRDGMGGFTISICLLERWHVSPHSITCVAVC
jgi:hypothetical protein